MDEFAVLTPSYAPDVDLCGSLNRSVLACTPVSVHHHVIVPRRDRDLFASMQGPRTRIWSVEDFIPRRMVAVPKANVWLNMRRPSVPVRGWVMQQVVKLRAAEAVGSEVLVLADSDVVFIRPVTLDTFRDGAKLRFYRQPDAVDARLPRHLAWHRVARRILGLPPKSRPPLPDYISTLNVWDRQVITQMRDRIEAVNRAPWLDTIARQPHVSEFILYGVFVDEVLGNGARVSPTDTMRCHSYWDPAPLDPASARSFVSRRSPDDVAVMISAKSGTTLEARRRALAGIGAGS